MRMIMQGDERNAAEAQRGPGSRGMWNGAAVCWITLYFCSCVCWITLEPTYFQFISFVLFVSFALLCVLDHIVTFYSYFNVCWITLYSSTPTLYHLYHLHSCVLNHIRTYLLCNFCTPLYLCVLSFEPSSLTPYHLRSCVSSCTHIINFSCIVTFALVVTI